MPEVDLGVVAQNRLDEGLIAYNPPRSVTQSEEFKVTVRLQRGVTVTSSALATLSGPGSPTIEKLPVGSHMTAALDGPGFDVRPITPSRLPLAPNEIAEFSWVVSAKSPGALTLTLTLVAEVRGEQLRQRSYERLITVNVIPDPGMWSRVTGWSGWSDVASGVLVALLVAGVTWFLAGGRRRRRSAAVKATAVPTDPAAVPTAQAAVPTDPAAVPTARLERSATPPPSGASTSSASTTSTSSAPTRSSASNSPDVAPGGRSDIAGSDDSRPDV